jgi:hypothetical protein
MNLDKHGASRSKRERDSRIAASRSLGVSNALAFARCSDLPLR